MVGDPLLSDDLAEQQQARCVADEGLGIVLYVRTAFGPRLEWSALVPVEPPVTLPFVLTWRADTRSAALRALLAAA